MTDQSSDHQRNRTFLARYGATLLRGGIATIPAALYRYQGELKLTAQQVWFVSAILSHKWDADLPYPSLKRMADETGVSRQQLHNYQRELVDRGWLRVINRQTELGGKDTNLYDFTPLFAQLEELLQRDKPGREVGYVNAGTHTHVNPGLHTHVNAAGHTHVNRDLHQEESLEESAQQQSVGVVKAAAENFSGEEAGGESTEVIQVLTKFGLTRKIAELYGRAYPPAYLLAKLDLCTWLVDTKSPLVAKNPAGYLRRAIEEDYQPPKAFRSKAEQDAEKQQKAARQQELQDAIDRATKRASTGPESPLETRTLESPATSIPGMDLSVRDAWESAKGILKKEISVANFQTFVAHSALLKVGKGVAVVAASNSFSAEYLETRLRSTIKKALAQVLGHSVEVEVIAADDVSEPAMSASQPAPRKRGRPRKTAANSPNQAEPGNSDSSGIRGPSMFTSPH